MNKQYQWDILHKGKVAISSEAITHVLLKNRGIKTKSEVQEFFNPKHPRDITLTELGIDEGQVKKAVKRLKSAIEKKEQIVVYGDYDADGVCSTAIMWQTLYALNKNTIPFMPDRFIDGYGLHADSISKLKTQNPQLSLIVTVDNGIVANKAVDAANALGIDVIISDHHQIGKTLPKAHAIVHTDMICGSALAWVVGRELGASMKRISPASDHLPPITDSLLDLCAIGTIADQMPLVGVNRSFAKHGIEVLNTTKRCGLLALFGSCAIAGGSLGTYEINYLIAPRINAMGRLESAMDSLRLLCTTNSIKARELAGLLGKVNSERQKIVEEIIVHAKREAAKQTWLGAIVIAHETYHEGVIGLVASKLVDEYYRPTIVLSKKKGVSKASARSIHGFNIIETIRKLDHLLSGGGGHPMAAGFSIETTKIEEFMKEMELLSKDLLTDDLLQRKLRVDVELGFNAIDNELLSELAKFNPSGIGNPAPLFVSRNVSIEDAVLVGAEKKHIKLLLRKNGHVIDAIAFHFAEIYPSLSPESLIDIVYSVELNVWNGRSTIQLKVKDIKIQK